MGNVKQTLRFYWKYTRQYPRLLSSALLVNIQFLLNVILVPFLIGLGIGKLSNPTTTGLSFRAILGSIALVATAAIVINRVSSKSLNKLEIAVTERIHADIAKHILEESYEFHSKSYSGALISQATRLASSYTSFMDIVFQSGFRFVIIVFFSSLTLAFYDVRLAMIMAATSMGGILTTVMMVRRRYSLQRDAIAKTSELTANLADMISNAVTVKTFAAEQYELNRYKKVAREAGHKISLAWAKQIDANNATLAMVAIMNISILGYGIYAVERGLLATGIFIAAQLYAVRLSGTFWDASSMVRNFERIFADAHEMVEILNTPVKLVDQPGALDLRVEAGELKFNDVSFHYSDTNSKDSVLTNFSLNLKPGEKVGLVGRSGGGKSTITKLVLRFMDIPSGSIEIDGQNITGITQNSLRGAVAYVPQEPLLFHRTIADNIGYGKTDVSKDEIIQAAKLAQAHDFILALPKQYDTEVGERGVKLSGGQRQRIAIARAMLKDAPILVLDEATSALDSESEIKIQKALWKLMEKRTALVIAHRLSTVQKMDRIVVVDNGRIIEQGTHAQLLDNKGTYADLWGHQSGGFLDD